MNRIVGVRHNSATAVYLDSSRLSIVESRKVYDHSTTFDWGFRGSGPAQTALGILLVSIESAFARGDASIGPMDERTCRLEISLPQYDIPNAFRFSIDYDGEELTVLKVVRILATKLHQDFKDFVIAGLPAKGFTHEIDIDDWVAEKIQERSGAEGIFR